MDPIYTSFYQIDHASNQLHEVDISTQGNDLTNYIDRLIEEITSSNNKRQFLFKSETTEVRTAIDKFLRGEHEEASHINSKRLLETEKAAQERIEQMGTVIPKGSLFQAVLEREGKTTIVISKADHNQFLDEIDFTLKNGLPWEKKIFKAFLVEFENNQPVALYVYDTSSRIARYWWDNFLELNEKFTDVHNTKTSLNILDSKIFNKIKRNYPADHTILRNSTIGYYRNNDEFNLTEYINDTFLEYEPVDPDFPKEVLITKIEELPNRWGFDQRFGIAKGEIKKKQKLKIDLTENIELVVKDYEANLSNIITAEQDAEGNKYIKIKSEVGYNSFNK